MILVCPEKFCLYNWEIHIFMGWTQMKSRLATFSPLYIASLFIHFIKEDEKRKIYIGKNIREMFIFYAKKIIFRFCNLFLPSQKMLIIKS